MSRVHRVIEVHARQHREHIGLDHRHQQFQRCQPDGHRQRRDGRGHAEGADAAEVDNEAGEHF